MVKLICSSLNIVSNIIAQGDDEDNEMEHIIEISKIPVLLSTLPHQSVYFLQFMPVGFQGC